MNDILNSTIFDDIANGTLIYLNSTTEYYNDATNISTTNHSSGNGSIIDDFPRDPCPESEVKLFEFWTNGVLLNAVGLLGILGNILSMIILSRPQMRSR